MVITNRACLLALFAMLSVSPLGSVLADPAIKPAITGLVSTGSTSNTLAELATGKAMGIFGGLVVQATWKDLQPTNGPLDTTIIDNALTQTLNDNVTKYNAASAQLQGPNNRQIGVRLRIFAGCTAGDNDAPE